MTIERTLTTYSDVKNKSDELQSSFMKHIILMASSLLGILISFHDTNSLNNSTRISFAGSLVLLTLGILLLSIGLFGQVSAHNKMALDYWEETRKHLLNELYHPRIVVKYPQKIYVICQKLGYVSFILFVISLTVYGILIS